MNTIHEPPDIPDDPPPATPYFDRRAEFAAAVEAGAARRGLPPDWLAA